MVRLAVGDCVVVAEGVGDRRGITDWTLADVAVDAASVRAVAAWGGLWAGRDDCTAGLVLTLAATGEGRDVGVPASATSAPDTGVPPSKGAEVGAGPDEAPLGVNVRSTIS